VLSGRVEWLGACAVAKDDEVFNAEGESRQLMLFPSDVPPPDENDPNIARVLINKEIR